MSARVHKKPAKDYHHGDLRRALLDAARVELHKVGVQKLSLRGVARRAGVTHTATYHHFADKGALLMQVAQEGFFQLDASMARAIEAAPQLPLARLHAAGMGYLRFAAADPAALMLMFDSSDPAEHSALVHGTDAFGRLVRCVQDARAAVGLSGDPLPDAMLSWSTVHGFAALSRGGRLSVMGIDGTEAFASALVDRLLTLYANGRAA